MTVEIQYLDRDEAVAMAKAEREEQQIESEIGRLIRQVVKAQQELRICEANLAEIRNSLSGNKD